MIERTFISNVLPYEYLCGDNGGVTLFADLIYEPTYCVPPRVWRQSLLFLTGLMVVKKETPTSDFVLWVIAAVSVNYWPGYDGIGWEVDGTTGKFLRFLEIGSTVYNPKWLKLGRGNRMIVNFLLLGLINEAYIKTVNPSLTDELYTNLVPFDLTKFGAWNADFLCFDEPTDTALIVTLATPPSHISLHSLSTGALVRHIPVCGTPVDAHWEVDNKAYVVSDKGVVTLIDYVTGRTFSVTKLNLPPSLGFSGFETGYDLDRKRLLFIGGTPNLADGSSTLRVEGFRNVPAPLRLTKPVPLSRPRVGQRTVFTTRIVGEIGELAGGATIKAYLDNGKEILVNSGSPTDAQGYGYFSMDGSAVGLEAIHVNGVAEQPNIGGTVVTDPTSASFFYSGYHPINEIFTLQVDKYVYSYTILSDEYEGNALMLRLSIEINFKNVGAVTGTVVGTIAGEVRGRVGGVTIRGVVTNGVFVGTSTGASAGPITCSLRNDFSASGTLTGTVVTGGAFAVAEYSANAPMVVRNVPADPAVASPTVFVQKPKIELIGSFT